MTINSVNPQTLKTWLDNGEAVLVDVREPHETSEEKIAEAHLIPLAQINFEALPDFSGKKIVLQCRSGARSGRACDQLSDERPDIEFFNLEGGIIAWKLCNLPTISSK